MLISDASCIGPNQEIVRTESTHKAGFCFANTALNQKVFMEVSKKYVDLYRLPDQKDYHALGFLGSFHELLSLLNPKP